MTYTPRRWRVLDDDQRSWAGVGEGAIVYNYLNYDGGSAADHSQWDGEPYVTVTLHPEGGRPYFTMPLRKLEEIKDQVNEDGDNETRHES